MRLAHVRTATDTEPWSGIVRDETVIDIAEAGWAAGYDIPHRIDSLVEEWAWRDKLESIAAFATDTDTGVYNRADLSVDAPILNPEKIICVGLNYRDHAEEGGRDVPETPILFSKFPSSIIGPEDTIKWDPSVTQKVDYEAELVVVIGEEARNLDPDEAWDAVAGYTVGNDVSARDIQHGDGQWIRGKSLDTFAPIGPELVTADEIDSPHELDIWTEVNGERLQDSSTEHLVFGVDELISFCSQTSTLSPGDIIFTGTPAGVGVFRDPPILLADGDTVEVGIESIGTLTHDCTFL